MANKKDGTPVSLPEPYAKAIASEVDVMQNSLRRIWAIACEGGVQKVALCDGEITVTIRATKKKDLRRAGIG